MSKRLLEVSVLGGLGLWFASACGPSVSVPNASGSGDGSSGGSSGSSSSGSAEATTAGPVPPPPPPPPTTDPTGASDGDSSTGPMLEPWEDVPPWTLPDDCGWLLEEQGYCLLMTDTETLLYGLDSGLDCEFPTPAFETPPGGTSWIGMSTAQCTRDIETGEPQVMVARLDTGEAVSFPMDCHTTGSDEDRLFVVSEARFDAPPMREYESYADLAADVPLATYPVFSMYQRVSVSRREAWLAPNTADTIESFDLQTGEPRTDLNVPQNEVEHGPFVYGPFEVVNDLIIIGSTNDNQQNGLPGSLSFFDRETGEFLEQRVQPRGRHVASLMCRSTR